MSNNVRLIAKTVPVIDECDTAAELIAFCARVSNPENQRNHETSEGLLKYCIRKKHWSVFEMADLVIEIETTRDIGRQILRHRSFCFQEFSQRYAEVQKMSFRECRLQDQENRQNSIELEWDNDQHQEIGDWFSEKQNAIHLFTEQIYKESLEKGIAKEQARCVLPEGMTMSVMYMKGSLRSWIHYCMLRMSNGTQKEHQIIAKKCWAIIVREFPQLKGLVL